MLALEMNYFGTEIMIIILLCYYALVHVIVMHENVVVRSI